MVNPFILWSREENCSWCSWIKDWSEKDRLQTSISSVWIRSNCFNWNHVYRNFKTSSIPSLASAKPFNSNRINCKRETNLRAKKIYLPVYLCLGNVKRWDFLATPEQCFVHSQRQDRIRRYVGNDDVFGTSYILEEDEVWNLRRLWMPANWHWTYNTMFLRFYMPVSKRIHSSRFDECGNFTPIDVPLINSGVEFNSEVTWVFHLGQDLRRGPRN